MTSTANISLAAHPGIAAGGCNGPAASADNPTHASTTMVGGKVQFENDNYRITMGDDNTVTIRNKNTGETYQAWGDPHMKIDGKQAFDFWGTTTFSLDDGTKLTIETTPWGNNPNATLSSKVTITNGDYGVHVTGVDTNTVGDLKFNETTGHGQLQDALVDDGNTIFENPAGAGFVGIGADGRLRAVDQQYINATDLKKGGALKDQFGPAFNLFAGLVAITFVGLFLSALSQRGGGERGGMVPRPQPLPRPDMWAGGSRSGLALEMGGHGWMRHQQADASFRLVLTATALHAAGKAHAL